MAKEQSMVKPGALRRGSKVAIVSPASKITPEYIRAAAQELACRGYEPVVMEHAERDSGTFSGTAADRLSDLHKALLDDSIDAILCSRGGYGSVHLLAELDELPAECFDKWLIGFSDITALHALWMRKGYASLHGAMAKYIGRGSDFECLGREMGVLVGKRLEYQLPGFEYNRPGQARGMMVGGNLAVLGGLIGTSFDPFETIFTDDRISKGIVDKPMLMIEDVAEPIYKVERILWQLRLRGVFRRVSAVLVGQFTEYRASADHPDMYTMMHRFFGGEEYEGLPIAFNLPFGHIEENQPLVLGVDTQLEVTPHQTKIVQL